MTTLGVFRDDYYNAVGVLAQTQIKTTTQNGGVYSAANLAGAQDCYLSASGQAGAQAITTDSAVNIIAQLQTAVQAAIAAGIAASGGSQSVPGGTPPPGAPNLFNLTYTLTVNNFNSAAGAITLAAGAGVTITGTNTIAINSQRQFVVSITSPTTVTLTSLYGATITAA